MLNECKPALLPLGGTSRVAKCYSTPFITNFVKNWFKELLPQMSFIWRMLVPMDRKLGPRLTSPYPP